MKEPLKPNAKTAFFYSYSYVLYRQSVILNVYFLISLKERLKLQLATNSIRCNVLRLSSLSPSSSREITGDSNRVELIILFLDLKLVPITLPYKFLESANLPKYKCYYKVCPKI